MKQNRDEIRKLYLKELKSAIIRKKIQHRLEDFNQKRLTPVHGKKYLSTNYIRTHKQLVIKKNQLENSATDVEFEEVK